ncbi:hypothetical protein SMACR_12789 [Sordaria macrospora]|uniref:Uncharacterized protein n=1 Tax=Sordaria macrospora TaxID=5147 RepID=A0A8S8ZFC5_SORMA|nr:hypothetical protein SMACR_12789 [Sordaria macrospora]
MKHARLKYLVGELFHSISSCTASTHHTTGGCTSIPVTGCKPTTQCNRKFSRVWLEARTSLDTEGARQRGD